MFQIKVSNKYTGDDFNEDLHTILCWVGCKSIAVLDVAMVLHFYRQLFSIFLKIFQNVLKCFPNILKCFKMFSKYFKMFKNILRMFKNVQKHF